MYKHEYLHDKYTNNYCIYSIDTASNNACNNYMYTDYGLIKKICFSYI